MLIYLCSNKEFVIIITNMFTILIFMVISCN
nr:MAG TPA: hypothetical protein [Caudoviricetes sp.]